MHPCATVADIQRVCGKDVGTCREARMRDDHLSSELLECTSTTLCSPLFSDLTSKKFGAGTPYPDCYTCLELLLGFQELVSNV
eukprot:1492349-Amphidinium_carterae.1